MKIEREQYQTEIRDLQDQLSEMHDELDTAKESVSDGEKTTMMAVRRSSLWAFKGRVLLLVTSDPFSTGHDAFEAGAAGNSPGQGGAGGCAEEAGEGAHSPERSPEGGGRRSRPRG